MGLTPGEFMGEIYKATVFCEYGRGGFSFSHYRDCDSHAECLTEVETLMASYLPLLGTGLVFPYIRVSQEKIRGDALLSKKVYGTRGQGDPAASVTNAIKSIIDDKPDVWWTALLMRLGASPSEYGHMFVRGIPDQLAISPDGVVKDNNWSNGFDNWTKALIDGKWGGMFIPRTPASQIEIAKIEARAAPVGYTITTKVNHNLAVGSKFRISGYKANAGLGVINGSWIVDAVRNGTEIDVLGYQGMVLPANTIAWGKLWSLTKAFMLFKKDYMVPMRLTQRKAGRPFDSLVGRRK